HTTVCNNESLALLVHSMLHSLIVDDANFGISIFLPLLKGATFFFCSLPFYVSVLFRNTPFHSHPSHHIPSIGGVVDIFICFLIRYKSSYPDLHNIKKSRYIFHRYHFCQNASLVRFG